MPVADEDVFMDNDTSAYLNKRRPGFDKMLARIKTGPSRVVVWHVDRLYRRPRELEDLIDLVESHPIPVTRPTASAARIGRRPSAATGMALRSSVTGSAVSSSLSRPW